MSVSRERAGTASRQLRTGDDLARLLADPQRLAIAGHLATGPKTLAELAAECSMSARDLHRQVPKLISAGLVYAEADTVRLNADLLRDIVEALPRAEPIRAHLVVGLSDEDAALASRYFDGERLVEIPVGQARRRAVLRILIDEFEPGRYYRESEVRRILRKFHPDDAALRRHLVEDGFLSRENLSRTYWRSPGPPPPPGS
jgi:hypothetical protein